MAQRRKFERVFRFLPAIAGASLALALLPPAFAEAVSVEYFYDEAGRLVGARYDDGASEIAYLYDSAGNVLQASYSVFVDADGNRIDDQWEADHFGAAGVDPEGDPDEDGRPNLEEFLSESDPNAADNVSLAVIGVFPGEEGQVARVKAVGAVEKEMVIEASEDLETWTESGLISLDEPEELPLEGGEARRFYRIRLRE